MLKSHVSEQLEYKSVVLHSQLKKVSILQQSKHVNGQNFHTSQSKQKVEFHSNNVVPNISNVFVAAKHGSVSSFTIDKVCHLVKFHISQFKPMGQDPH
jgi:hypothetical protein